MYERQSNHFKKDVNFNVKKHKHIHNDDIIQFATPEGAVKNPLNE